MSSLSNPLSYFLGKNVRVKVEVDFEVTGIFLHYQLENREEHKPFLLLLKDNSGYHVVRGNWINISEAKT
jgi:hypothetical protein